MTSLPIIAHSADRTRSEHFGALLEPGSVAVAGASTSGGGPGARFIRTLRGYGFRGRMYAVHPTATEVEGVDAYPSFADLPEVVDYAFVATPAEVAIDQIRSAQGRVRFAQVMASGFGEASGGGDDRGWQRAEQLRQAAQDSGVRVLGPNCLGTHSPKGRLTYIHGASTDTGTVAVVCQSGGLSIDIVRRGTERGLKFRGVVTVGNCVDVSAAELVDYFVRDPETAVIAAYIESVADGQDLFRALSRARAVKPVVLLKGGRTQEGVQAASSHTGALASDDRVWSGLCRQTGTVLVESTDELLDALAAFQQTRAFSNKVTNAVALFGNGGGASVLASDELGRKGFRLAQLSRSTSTQLRRLELPPGTGLRNPIDTPAGTLSQRAGRVGGDILKIVGNDSNVDALVMHVNFTVMLSNTDQPDEITGNLLAAAREFQSQAPSDVHFLMVARDDGSPDVSAITRKFRHQLNEAGIAVFPDLANAIRALACLRAREEALLGPKREW